ncbi:hypothetical protein [Agaribacterium sp. ZY112]|uniref:hypothetical protein n=1 Tax=Agaribacterium sp. ZY112 TaxID=3233574 RepID=UPI0035252629
MSLINDALSDLEQRQAGSVKSKSSYLSYLVLLALVCFVAGALVAAGYWLASSSLNSAKASSTILKLSSQAEHKSGLLAVKNSESELVETKDSLNITGDQKAEPLAEVSTASKPSVLPAQSPQVQPNPEEQLALRKTMLSNKAEQAYKGQRLTIPENDSAVFYYRQLLVLDSQNEAAIQGMVKVKKRYVALYKQALEQSDKDKAELYLTRLSSLLSSEEVPVYGKQIDTLRQEYLAAVNSKPRQESHLQEPKLADAALNSDSSSALSISKSGQQRSTEKLLELESLIAQGDLIGARQFAEQHKQALVTDERFVDALLTVYLAQQDWLALNALLTEQESQDRVYPFYQAKLIQHYQGDNTARKYLSSHKNMSSRARAMYASLLQKNKQYEPALNQYRILIEGDTNNALYWLGRAINADKLKLYDEARTAYSASARIGGHSKAIEDFIRERYTRLEKLEQAKDISQS